jgi:glutathione S-transferase
VIRLFEFQRSGNCHKVRLMLSLLGLAYDSVQLDPDGIDHKSAKFLAMNPFGEVPVLVDGDLTLRESQAILVYLARCYGSSDWLPEDASGLAEVTAWLCTAANEVAQGPMALRAHHKLGRPIDLAAAQAVTARLLGILDGHLSERNWLALGWPTVADVAVYPYLALAPDAHIDLVPYPAVRAWLGRVRALPGYLGMPGMLA